MSLRHGGEPWYAFGILLAKRLDNFASAGRRLRRRWIVWAWYGVLLFAVAYGCSRPEPQDLPDRVT